MDFPRYSKVTNKNKREILLLKASPCKWGRCKFCDYILDNSENEEENIKTNEKELQKVTGEFGVLEVINSGSIFELPKKNLDTIKKIVQEKDIKLLIFEAHWIYRKRLQELKDFFNIPVIYKLGLETFDDNFRNNVLNKGIIINHPTDVSKYYDSICLMVGIKGQTKESIDKDIEYLLKYFKKGCINIWIENSTGFKRDNELVKWFKEKYYYLESNENIEILWNNTDFGVGGEN
ncbi:radical SAM protein [uncultured Clostridium sp.]|uniref:radical SAM protein n=1 Tax=uncultured Clostridium sp. TaxID=59620 RepID=UPI0025DF44E5|nr:radical SAM protein [uncultured Clostridium sp.]